ncbi:MAG: circularly permuted type 2 ATP-grasp protein [Leptospiraceae bacterium]|nr:circularly permuted type 2 ATP-grasp protein [Leptospiraceae bacterium]
MLMERYSAVQAFDEMVTHDGGVRPQYESLGYRLKTLGVNELVKRKSRAEKALFASGITFTLYGEGSSEDRILPFDIIPRIIRAEEWQSLEAGLIQRTLALNAFLADIYGKQHIIRDKIIAREVVESSPGYLPQCAEVKPARGIYTNISGTDLVRGEDGAYMVLEDNLRCPSGVSYVLENREVMKQIFPELFANLRIRPVSNYPFRLRQALSYLSERSNPTIALLTPGIYNSAYFEHSYLAQQMGISLVENKDLIVESDKVYMKTIRGLKQVDVIYRRTDDTFLDPQVFRKDSLLGVPGIFKAYRKGNVAIANAPGTGVADDKVVYAYVPEMIKYYLGEEAIIGNVPTYLCFRDDDRRYVVENLDKMVVKAANGAGGYGMLIGPHASQKERDEFKEKILTDPRGYIAQPMIALSTAPTMIDRSADGEGRVDAAVLSAVEPRHIDLRPYIVFGKDCYVLPSGLTRVALKKGSLVVNSSQGGGTKDTWVLDT